MEYEDLKSYFHYSKNYIDVDKRLVYKYQLSIWDIREMVRLMECVDNYTEATTINKRVANVLMKYGVILIPNEIGWSL